LQPATPFTPSTPNSASAQASAGLSAGAAAFTPRAKSTIKISRPDGTSVNLAEEAAAAKGPTPSSTSGIATPEQSAEEPPKPQKKVPGLPVVVRLESEDQKRHRLEEEARITKMKEQEKREEAERKERQERRAKEEAESKAKAEADAKTKADEEARAKEAAEAKVAAEAQEAAEVKAKEEAEAEAEAAKAKQETESTPKQEAEQPALEAKEERPETPKSDIMPEEPAAATPAGDKADELRRSLLTPTTQSAAPSPLASPALAAAGLPAKPVTTIGGAAPRRPTPSLEAKSPAPNAKASTSGPSALSKAKAIDDLGAIAYPTTVKPQSAELNANGEPGKFRYERDFLMQFQKICKDKPDSLPPLEEIGLEADSGSGFGTRRPPRPSNGPNRSMSGGMGLMGGRNPAMGAFSTSFGSGNIRGSSSEERYIRSLQTGNRMGRTSSQGNNLPPMHGIPMGHSGSNRGRPRESGRGRPRAAQDSRHSANDPDVTPLVVSANAWVNARSAGSDEKSPVFIERKVKALLNKLTEEKFDSISEQILEWANKSREETDGMTLKLVIKLVFEKSTDEAHWSAMYAKLCRKLLDKLDPSVTEVIDGKAYTGGSLFRKYLLGRCQSDFESGWKAREEAALAAVAKSDEDKERLAKAEETKEDGNSEAPMMSDEYYALQKAKRRGLGLVQLIGELYKLDMLSKGVIRECLVRLLSNVENPDEEDLESTCKLLTTVGKQFEAAASSSMDVVFERLEALTKLDSVTSRIRFMIMVSNIPPLDSADARTWSTCAGTSGAPARRLSPPPLPRSTSRPLARTPRRPRLPSRCARPSRVVARGRATAVVRVPSPASGSRFRRARVLCSAPPTSPTLVVA
jgi:translation initiation factor 4G